MVEKILDCNNIQTPLTEDEFKELETAYDVAVQYNNIAFNSKKSCDSRWSYIIGYMLHTYGSTPDIKKEAITYLDYAAIGDKNERCAAACYLLGTIYIKQKNTAEAYMFFALAYDSGCELAAEEALKIHTGDTYQSFIDFYKDKIYKGKNKGGRRTHRKKRELRKRTLRKKSKNRTKRRA